MATRSYTQRDIKMLYGKSAMYCAYPECRMRLHIQDDDGGEELNLGEICHIVAFSADGPRGQHDVNERRTNSYDNLILLCGNHHKLIDGLPERYTATQLLEWKKDLESWVRRRLDQGMADVKFVEIEQICSTMVSNPTASPSGYDVIPPERKMKVNNITSALRYELTLGLAQSHQVAKYIETVDSKLDPGFSGRLRGGFVNEYNRLVLQGEVGDILFRHLWEFAYEAVVSRLTPEDQLFRYRSAALAVMSHLFQVCDIFEKEENDIAE